MWDWIKGLIPENINLNLNVPININIGSFNNDKSAYIEKRTLVINDKTKDIAKKIIKGLPEHIDHNDFIIDANVNKEFEEIDATMSSQNFQKQLKFYSVMVPKKDIAIIEVAIIIRTKYNNGQTVHKEKSDIVARYEQRGAMICNLFTAGYFDSIILPMYKDMKSGTLSPADYSDIYEMFVTESPLAVFVGLGSEVNDIEEKIRKQIKINQKLEIRSLNIHGIGDSNVKKIRAALKSENIEKELLDLPKETLTGKTIKTRIVF